jgi:hypothetical protein
MSSLFVDLFKKDMHGNAIWIDAVGNLDAARLPLTQLASVIPGEYLYFDHEVVVSVLRSGSHRIGGRDVGLRNEVSALRWDRT